MIALLHWMDGDATTAKRGRASSGEIGIVGADKLAFTRILLCFSKLTLFLCAWPCWHWWECIILLWCHCLLRKMWLALQSYHPHHNSQMQLPNDKMIASAIPQYFLSKNATTNQPTNQSMISITAILPEVSLKPLFIYLYHSKPLSIILILLPCKHAAATAANPPLSS